MIRHDLSTDKLIRKKIREREILYAGNERLKIFGLFSCNSGKKIKRTNRVFFKSEEDAWKNGYRPCSHCMRSSYIVWRNLFLVKCGDNSFSVTR
jgi:methylphosphotriester-DNA--protein-cysteine methyltransferase